MGVQNSHALGYFSHDTCGPHKPKGYLVVCRTDEWRSSFIATTRTMISFWIEEIKYVSITFGITSTMDNN